MDDLPKALTLIIFCAASVSFGGTPGANLSPDWIKNKSIESVQLWTNQKNSAQKIAKTNFQLRKPFHVDEVNVENFVRVLEAYHRFQLGPFGFKEWNVSEYGVTAETTTLRLRLRGTYTAPSAKLVYFDEVQIVKGTRVEATTFYSEGQSIAANVSRKILDAGMQRLPAANTEEEESLNIKDSDSTGEETENGAAPYCAECATPVNPRLSKTTKTVSDVLKRMGDRNDVCQGVNPSRRDWIGLAGAEPWSWKRTMKHQLEVATMRDEVMTCLKGIIVSMVTSARSFVSLGAHIAHDSKKFEHWVFHHHDHGAKDKAAKAVQDAAEASAGDYAENDISAAGDVAVEKASEAEKIKSGVDQAKHHMELALQGNMVTKIDDALNVAVSEQMCKSIEERFEDVCRQLVLSPLGALPMSGMQGALYSQTIGMVGESVGAVTQNGFAAEAADAVARKFLPKRSPDGLNLTPAAKMPAEAVKAAQDQELHWYVHPFTVSRLEMARLTYTKDGVTQNQIVYRLKKAGHDELFFGTGNPPAADKLNKLFDQKQDELPNADALAPKNSVFLETEPGFYKRINAADGVSLTDGQSKHLAEKIAPDSPLLATYIGVVQAVGYRAATERNMHELFTKLNPVDVNDKAAVKTARLIEKQRVDTLENREVLLEDVNKLVLKTDDVLKGGFFKQLSEVIHADTNLAVMNSYEQVTHELAKKSGSSFDERVDALVSEKVKKGFIGGTETQALSACLRSPAATTVCQSLILRAAPAK